MPTRLQVLVLTTAYPTPEAPVAGIFVRNHALAAAEHCDIRVVLLERAATAGVHVEPLTEEPLRAWRVRFPRRPNALSMGAILLAARAGLRTATRDGFDPDVIHAHFFLAGFPAVLLGRRRKTPVVITEHWSVFLPDDPATLSGPLRFGARFALEHADLVLPVSAALDAGIAAHGITARTSVVPNVVDERVFHPPSSHARSPVPRLLSVALLYEAKGIDLLIRALARLKRGGRAFRLDIVGDGELRDEYEQLVRALELDDAVVFHGILPQADVAELMRAADLYVLPSRYDNNPSALIESRVTGLPSVATAVGGVAEIVDGGGILTTPDVERIADALADALDRLDSFDRAAIARQASERYGADAVGRRLAEIYAELAGR